MVCEAPLRVAQGIQAPGVGTDFEGEAARAGAGDPREDAAGLKSDRLRRFFSTLSRTPLFTR